jgi:hypothetical protein
LGIDIDQQNPLPDGRQAGAQIDSGRRLTDAALLVGDGENAGRPSV